MDLFHSKCTQHNFSLEWIQESNMKTLKMIWYNVYGELLLKNLDWNFRIERYLSPIGGFYTTFVLWSEIHKQKENEEIWNFHKVT